MFDGSSVSSLRNPAANYGHNSHLSAGGETGLPFPTLLQRHHQRVQINLPGGAEVRIDGGMHEAIRAVRFHTPER